MADSSVFTFCSLLISSEHSQSSSKQVLKTSPCVYLNKTVYQQQLNPNDVYSFFPIRPTKVRMRKATDPKRRKLWIREDRSWAHDHCVSKQTVRSDSGWVKTWDPQQQYSLPSPSWILSQPPAFGKVNDRAIFLTLV